VLEGSVDGVTSLVDGTLAGSLVLLLLFCPQPATKSEVVKARRATFNNPFFMNFLPMDYVFE
jgi:hypothetical protein